MKPIEALDDAIRFGILMDSLRFKKPGAIIEKLKPEVREALKKLTCECCIREE